jgi:hypothetical protein
MGSGAHVERVMSNFNTKVICKVELCAFELKLKGGMMPQDLGEGRLFDS